MSLILHGGTCRHPYGSGIGLPLIGWQLAVVDELGEPVPMGRTGELVIGGAGLARYLDPVKDAEKFAPLPALGWQRAYHSGDVVRAEPEGLVFLGRADEQVKLGGRRIELGEVDSALQALPGVAGAAAAVRTTTAGNQILVGYVAPAEGRASGFDQRAATDRLRDRLPAALVPLIAVVEELPTRTSGKVDRAALPWPLPDAMPGTAVSLSGTEAWLAEGWAEILGVTVTDRKADFFTNGGGSLTAAQLVARIRTRYPHVSVTDIYQNPRLAALARMLDAQRAATTERRRIAPVPRRAGVLQCVLLLPMLTLVGLRWTTAVAAVSTVLAGVAGVAWAPTAPWWGLAVAWALLSSPAGRVAIAAGGARMLLRGLRPGSYARGGGVHLRLWAAQQLADLSGANGVSGASWMTHYARALGAKVGKDVDLHSPPPVTGMLKLGRGAAIEPEVDLSGYWVDGDVVHIGKIRAGAGARIGARSTLFPGARIGKGAEIAAGSTVLGAVPAGQRWAGSPARREHKNALACPSARPPRSRRLPWSCSRSPSRRRRTSGPPWPSYPWRRSATSSAMRCWYWPACACSAWDWPRGTTRCTGRKKGSSYLGMPPMPLRRAVETADARRTFRPPPRLRLARAAIELCRIVPVCCTFALAVLTAAALQALHLAFGLWAAALLSGAVLLAAGVLACVVTTVAKWSLVGRFRPVERPLWSSFVWRGELADTFVEVLAVPWLAGSVGGTPLLPAWLRTMGARIGRGVWLETYWLPESDLVRLGAGATVNRGCVVQTHLFHDRITSMDRVTLDDGATLGPHGIVLPGASIGARTTVGPGSLVTRGDAVPADSRWLGNAISAWPEAGGRRTCVRRRKPGPNRERKRRGTPTCRGTGTAAIGFATTTSNWITGLCRTGSPAVPGSPRSRHRDCPG